MARTVNTTNHPHRNGAWSHDEDCPMLAPTLATWRGGHCTCAYRPDAHTLSALRYSRDVLATAAAEGRRPLPEARVHRMPRHTGWGRLWNTTVIGHYAAWDEATARGRSRRDNRAALTRANAALRTRSIPATGADGSAGEWDDLYDVLDDLDFEPARHRHNAIWLAY